MRISLVGSGLIGTAHATRLDSMDRVDELLVSDFVAGRAAELAAKLTKARPVSVDEAFAPDVDGVVITAKTSLHADLLHRALDAGLPVFCEKPIALDLETTKEVVEHAERAGTLVQIGFQRRFDAGYNRAKQAYRAGEFGAVHTLNATTFDAAPPSAAYVPTSGGLFRDCNSHDFDIIAWLTGLTPISIYTVGSNLGEPYFGEYGDVDSGSSLVTYEGGMVAMVSASRNSGAGHDVRLEIFGTDGGMFVGLDDRAPLRTAEADLSWRQAEPYLIYHERFEDAYVAELAHFLDVIQGAPNLACTPAEALEALYLAEAASQSRVAGAPIPIADLKK